MLASVLLWIVLLVSMLGSAPALAQAQVGFQAHSYSGFGANSNGAITGEKPESKLWYHDGMWWAALLSPAAGGAHRIFRLTGTTWVDTGVAIDPLSSSKEDVLSLGDTLYVVSRNSWKLRRYTYSAGTYTLDPGFPVTLPLTAAETLTVARDSTGTLWITWEEGQAIKVARSLGSDTSWGAPFTVPVADAAGVSSDDIASIIAFTDGSGPAIGVMWSNQPRDAQYFAVHRDGAPDSAWVRETALSGPDEADDHISLKTFEGRVFAAVKTSIDTTNQPLIRLLVRSPAGIWSVHLVANKGPTQDTTPTRPITELMIDTLNRDLYVFMSRQSGGIEYRRSDVDTIGFPPTSTPFITGSGNINNATSAKQNLTAATGIVVLASDGSSYWWNRIDGVTAPTAQFTGSPTSGTAPLAVQFTDQSTAGPTSWAWDFGDGGTSLAQHPSHVYAAPGTFTVTLIASNAIGSDTETKSGYVTVTDPGAEMTFTATADARVVSTDPDTNFGTKSDLRVRKTSSAELRSYITFTVTGLAGPANVRLRLFVTDPSVNGGTIHTTSSAWTESGTGGITWNTAPPPGTQVGSLGPTTTGVYVDAAAGSIPGSGTYSFVLLSTSSDLAKYNSRSTTSPPQLVVTPI